MRFPERERRRIRSLRRLRPELSEALEFLAAATELAPADADEFPVDRLKPPTPGFPPLSPDTFPLDEPKAAEDLRRLLDAFVEATGSAEAGTVLRAAREGRLDLRRLVSAYRSSDREPFEIAAGRLEGIEPPLLIHLTELAVKPQFIAAARALGESGRKADAGDRPDTCPLCGSAPDLLLVEDRRDVERIAVAVCRLCESEWPVKRVRCLACGNEDTESLSYLQAEGEEDLRANVCEVCHHYIPLLDARGRLEVAPMVERIAAAHLDVVAGQRGYAPLEPAWYAWSGAQGRGRRLPSAGVPPSE